MVHDLARPLCAAILQQSADAIIYANRDGKIQRWNSAAERMFGFTAKQALGQSLDIVIPEHPRTRHWAGYRMAV
jgi:PAS domain S-box-containing protein